MINRQDHAGASLLELVIATALSLWLLSGLLFVYLSSQRTSQTIRARVAMQENADTATYLLTRAVRSAGYCGCLPLTQQALTQLSADLNPFPFKQATRLVAWHQGISTSSLQLPNAIKRTAKPDSDILLVQNMIPQLERIKSAPGRIIHLATKPNYSAGDNLILADCMRAVVLHVDSVSAHNLTVTPSLRATFAPSSQLGNLSSTLYYVRDTGRNNKVGQPITALYRRDMQRPSAVAQEIIEGVEQVQIRFGIASQRKIIYKPIPQMRPADWSNILTVRITLLLTSLEPIAASYPTAQRLQKAWTMTVALRQPMLDAHE